MDKELHWLVIYTQLIYKKYKLEIRKKYKWK